mmetsp:Transcript_51084/g.59677  ORF Transcript_51084/g.59677 Transcript_51084/m.59677 type:complete len:99 (+) Transcript_51084:43-339(+)
MLNITDDVLSAKLLQALRKFVVLSLVINFPTQTLVPHSITNAFKAAFGVSIVLKKYSLEQTNLYSKCMRILVNSSDLVEEAAVVMPHSIPQRSNHGKL